MKFILTTMLSLMSVVANAQKLEGMYNADKEFEDMANEYVGKVIEQKDIRLGLDIKVGLSLFFNGDNIDLIINVSGEMESVRAKGAVTFMGTYTREGNHVVCTFSKDRMSPTISKLESDDPDIKEALETNEDFIYKVAEERMDELVAPHADELFKATKFFKEFDITSQTDTSIKIQLTQGQEINLFKP